MCAVCTLIIIFWSLEHLGRGEERRRDCSQSIFTAKHSGQEERRWECPQSLFYFVPQEISQPSILGSREEGANLCPHQKALDCLCRPTIWFSLLHALLPVNAPLFYHPRVARMPQCLHNITQYHNTEDTTMPAQYKMQRTVYVVHCSSTVKYTLVFAKDTSHVHTAP